MPQGRINSERAESKRAMVHARSLRFAATCSAPMASSSNASHPVPIAPPPLVPLPPVRAGAETPMMLVDVACAPELSVTVRLTLNWPAALGVIEAVAPLVAPVNPLTMGLGLTAHW